MGNSERCRPDCECCERAERIWTAYVLVPVLIQGDVSPQIIVRHVRAAWDAYSRQPDGTLARKLDGLQSEVA